ncbi:hypothetical protein FB451DRAFT_1240534 [Mycena latifolia]|nr:hypothetical protein FB451DRAFT_1240534 [Mycena latifolia]
MELPGSGNGAGSSRESGRRGDDGPGDAVPELDDDRESNPNYGGGGLSGNGGGDGGDGGGGGTGVDDKWESQLHRTHLKLHLKLNTSHTYAISIGYKFKFTINRETDLPVDFEKLSRSLSQPEVVALVDFKIETRPRETQVDRSYANIGFVAHRKESIIEREFLHRGFDPPDKLYKRGRQEQVQRGLKATLGFSSGSPMATAAFSYDKNHDFILEATDSKIMPRCRVDYETGDEWDEGSKSYSSYNVAYQQQDIPLEPQHAEFHPLQVKIGMGINLRPSGSEEPLPKLSFINRNQVLIWVADPASKARVRGIMVLTSSYIDNIRAEEKLSIYEQEEIDLTSPDKLSPGETKQEGEKPGTISLSIARIQRQRFLNLTRFGTAVPAFVARLSQRASNPVVALPPHEYLARGWDVTNNQWRSVLWPALDEHFRAADLERTSPVWNLEWKVSQKTIATKEKLGKGKAREEGKLKRMSS